MKYNKFIDLDRDIDDLCEKREYEEALSLFEKGLETLPEEEKRDNYFMLMWVKTVLQTMCNKYDECFEVIKGVINEGYSFPIHFDRFKPLKEKSGYKELVTQNDRLLRELDERAAADFKVHVPENYNREKEYPLFIALHGDGISNIQELSNYWKPDVFLNNDFIFAYFQSSQAICHNGYGWTNDIKVAREDIKNCYDSIAREYLIDESSIYIGGFSGGATTSIDFNLSYILPVKGFIALCPGVKPEAFTREIVELAAKRGVKGVLLEGELELPVEDEEEMLKVFNEVNFPYEYYINKGIGHRAPDDFDDKLSKALRFLMD